MPSYDLLAAFFVAAAIFAFLPGPAMLYTVAQTMARGRRCGLMAAFGVHMGGYVHVLAAVLGLSVLFTHVPVLYMALKIAGALYLVWLGVRIIRQKIDPRAVFARSKTAGRQSFFESVTVEVLNPKTAIFFVSFLPQFVDPSAAWSVSAQLLVLGVIVNIMFSIADILCVGLASVLVSQVKNSGIAQRLAKIGGGSILIGLGAHLALSRH